MSISISDPATLKAEIVAAGRAAGFDIVRVSDADAAPEAGPRLDQFLAAGRQGSMDWLARTADRRRHPKSLWADVRSVILLGLNYGPEHDPLGDLERREQGTISVYARGDDYHDLIKKKLKQVAGEFARRAGADVKVFVDTAPVMEKPLAEAAGLGWQGKHTNLVSREFGSWLFIGAIFTDAALPPDAAEADHCGSCRACLDICPTDAFPAPYQLDARRCISYLTIEHDGPIPHEFRASLGNRIFGCDDCLAVCPWNKFAQAGREAKLAARAELEVPSLEDLARLDDAAFRALFRKSPVKRTGRARFVRNVLIAIGNSGARRLIPAAKARLDDESAQVRGAAVWALSRLMSPQDYATLARSHMEAELHADVRAEWRVGLAVMEPAGA